MKKNANHHRLFWGVMLILCWAIQPVSGAGQPIVGKWTRTAAILTEADGTVTDMQPLVEKQMPCVASIVYEFTASGAQKTIIPGDCLTAMKPLAKLYADAEYVLTGNKLTVKAPAMPDFPPSVYLIKIQGDTMTWDFQYADNPSYPNPTKAKHLRVVYKKV